MRNRSIAIIILAICVIITGYFCYFLWNNHWRPYGDLKMAETGQAGDFFGGVVGTLISGGAFYFLYLTFFDQRRAIVRQQIAFEKERLESKFFDLIGMHRDNVKELTFDHKSFRKGRSGYIFISEQTEGKKVFKAIFDQFIQCAKDVGPFAWNIDKVYEPVYKTVLESNPMVMRTKLSLMHLAKIDICYSIVFYGLDSEGLILLKNKFSGKYKINFITNLLNYLALRPLTDKTILQKWAALSEGSSRRKKREISKAIRTWRDTPNRSQFTTGDPAADALIVGYHNKFTKYYGGHQFRLGHYYRHLYQMVKYINQQVHLSYEEKYEYVKHLRAQLSTYEQAVLFLNSLSSMGRVWELNPEIMSLPNYTRQDFELITKYNMIKNIPGETLYGLVFKEFYPDVEYETGSVTRDNTGYH